jgi:hypothetical protein
MRRAPLISKRWFCLSLLLIGSQTAAADCGAGYDVCVGRQVGSSCSDPNFRTGTCTFDFVDLATGKMHCGCIVEAPPPTPAPIPARQYAWSCQCIAHNSDRSDDQEEAIVMSSFSPEGSPCFLEMMREYGSLHDCARNLAGSP